MNVVTEGIVGSALAGAATGLGALPLLVSSRISPRAQDRALAFGAGVMLAASAFSLIPTALETVAARIAQPFVGALAVAGAVLLGALVVAWASRRVHAAGRFARATDSRALRLHLFVAVVTLHNLPEGLAVGAAFGGSDVELGLPVALAIGLQNVPEGLSIAVALRAAGNRRRTAALVTLASGLVEPVMGAVGSIAVVLARDVLPWALSLAAGAMLCVVLGDVLPETRTDGLRASDPTLAMVLGFVVMMALDAGL